AVWQTFGPVLHSPPWGMNSPTGVAKVSALPAAFGSLMFLSSVSFPFCVPRYTHRLPLSACGSFGDPKHGGVGDSASASFRYLSFNDDSSGYLGLNDTTPSASACGPPLGTAMWADHPPVSANFVFK